MSTKQLWSIIAVLFGLLVSLVGYVFASSNSVVEAHGREITRLATRTAIAESHYADIIRRLERIERKIDRVSP